MYPKSNSYIKLQKIAELIELFYENKEDMQYDYFLGNLNNLIAELSKYGSYDEIINLIIDIDILFYNKTFQKFNDFKIKRKLLSMYSRQNTKDNIKKFKKKNE